MKIENIKKPFVLIGLGLVNILHGGLHLIQFLQSILLVNESVTHHDSGLDRILHNPIFALVWGLVGLMTLYIGIKDYIHHRKCKHKHGY